MVFIAVNEFDRNYLLNDDYWEKYWRQTSFTIVICADVAGLSDITCYNYLNHLSRVRGRSRQQWWRFRWCRIKWGCKELGNFILRQSLLFSWGKLRKLNHWHQWPYVRYVASGFSSTKSCQVWHYFLLNLAITHVLRTWRALFYINRIKNSSDKQTCHEAPRTHVYM